MSRQNYIFTSESVSEGHPDKVCDQISDAVLDAFLSEESEARVACETFATTNRVVVGGEVKLSTEEKVIAVKDRVDTIVRECVKDIGYEQTGFDWRDLEVTNLLHGQSEHIAQGVDAAERQGRGRGRPGDHVRLCRRRDAGADAGADPICPRDPASGWPKRASRAREPSSARTPRARSRCATRTANRSA